MDTRTERLIAQLKPVNERTIRWKSELPKFRAEADTALKTRIFEPGKLTAAKVAAQLIAAESVLFRTLVTEFSDVAGVRDGHVNGLGVLLDQLHAAYDRIVHDIESVRRSAAA